MDAHRVDIFHAADRNAVSPAVAHNLILNLLPARNAPLHKHLPRPGKPEPVFQYLSHLFYVMGNAASAASQRVRRAQHYRITNFPGKFKPIFHILHHQRGGARLSDLLHRPFKFLPVFRLLYRVRRCSCKPHMMLF